MPEEPSVFVLMPFDAAFTDVYEQLIRTPLEAAGFLVRRADSLFNQQQILKDVVKGIADATLVIADVTGLNENVLYELGLAHALGKRTVMITQKLDDLPFDLRAYRANEYSMLFHKAGELKDLLAKVGEAVLRGEADFSNPIQDFAPYALGRATQPTVVPLAGGPSYRGGDTTDVDSASADDEPGFLEHRVALGLGSAKVVQIRERLGGFTEEVGNKFSGYSEKMVRANTNLGDRAAGALLAIARDAAEDLNLYAEQIEPLTGERRTALGRRGGWDKCYRSAWKRW